MSETCRLLLDNLWLAFSGIHAICFSGTKIVYSSGFYMQCSGKCINNLEFLMRMLLEIDCFPTGFLDKNVVVRGTAY